MMVTLQLMVTISMPQCLCTFFIFIINFSYFFLQKIKRTFYPNELEIGSAYSALSLGKYLYLSVSFLGED